MNARYGRVDINFFIKFLHQLLFFYSTYFLYNYGHDREWLIKHNYPLGYTFGLEIFFEGIVTAFSRSKKKKHRIKAAKNAFSVQPRNRNDNKIIFNSQPQNLRGMHKKIGLY